MTLPDPFADECAACDGTGLARDSWNLPVPCDPCNATGRTFRPVPYTLTPRAEAALDEPETAP